jgi:ABC-type multidrug transport system fused ATPase/permease subunit
LKRDQTSLWSLSLLRPYVKEHQNWLTISAASSFLYALCAVVISIVIQHLTDQALNQEMNRAYELLYLSIGIILFYAFLSYLSNYAKEHFNLLVVRDLQNKATRTLQELPLSFIEQKHSGDFVTRINQDTTSIAGLIKNSLDLFYQPIVFIGASVYLIIISPKLWLSGIILIPISSYLFNRLAKPIQHKSKELMEIDAKLNSLSQDALNGSFIVKSFNLQDDLYQKYEKQLKQVTKKSLEIQKIRMMTTPIFLLLRFLPQLIIPLYGGFLAMEGEISIGQLLGANLIIWSIFIPVESFLNLLQQIRSGIPAVIRLFEIIDHDTEQREFESKPLLNGNASIRIHQVHFSYSNSPNIKDVSLFIEAGKTTALVGMSGSGKSTLIKLIMGIYMPQSGSIQIGECVLNQENLKLIRSKIAYVSQDSHLYAKSIYDNIAYGRQGASDEEVIEAAKQANAHDFILTLPEQYNTKVGKAGQSLSGGQKQRIAIARALLKDAPILILDEPTSALDTESEAIITEALSNVTNKTIIIVAHRLSTIQNADEIVVMDKGQIIERGTHASLMETSTHYQNYFKQQIGSIPRGGE